MAQRGKWSEEDYVDGGAREIEKDVFTWTDPKRIAASLKHTVEGTHRMRARSPFQSAMSMISFYMNRAGADLSEDQKNVLLEAKVELRRQFGRV